MTTVFSVIARLVAFTEVIIRSKYMLHIETVLAHSDWHIDRSLTFYDLLVINNGTGEILVNIELFVPKGFISEESEAKAKYES